MPDECIQIDNACIFGQCIFIQNGGVLFDEIQVGCDFDEVNNGNGQEGGQPKAKIEVIGVVFVVSHDGEVIFSDVEGGGRHDCAYKKYDNFEEVCSRASIDVVDQADYVYQDDSVQQFKSREGLSPALGVDGHIRAHAQSQDKVYEQRHEDADGEPREISLI